MQVQELPFSMSTVMTWMPQWLCAASLLSGGTSSEETVWWISCVTDGTYEHWVVLYSIVECNIPHCYISPPYFILFVFCKFSLIHVLTSLYFQVLYCFLLFFSILFSPISPSLISSSLLFFPLPFFLLFSSLFSILHLSVRELIHSQTHLPDRSISHFPFSILCLSMC